MTGLGRKVFASGDILLASEVQGFLQDQAVMVFDDDAARTAAIATPTEGMLTYTKDNNALQVFDGTSFTNVGGSMKEKRIEAFTASGTFTVPAGVTYAIAHMLGGGGGVGVNTSGSAGGASSVAFASGTVTCNGLSKVLGTDSGNTNSAGAANTGQNAQQSGGTSANNRSGNGGATGVFVVAAAAVSPEEEITVTVGAGGAAGTTGADGGSGYVYIEFLEAV